VKGRFQGALSKRPHSGGFIVLTRRWKFCNLATWKWGGSMGGFNLQELMSKAKSQYDSLQKKMQETVVEATAGGGTVTAKMDGRKQLLSLRIDPEAVKSGDVEMLQDMVLAAINEAARKVDAQMQSTVGGMLGGLGIPGL
jgi:DNA-binding YbaB/EbfC family protein